MFRDKHFWIGLIFVGVAAFLVALMTGCTQPDRSRALLEAQGYKDVQITGYSFWSCSQDDSYATAFVATSPAGQQIKGTVCAGMFFKGATIRFD